MQSRLDAQYHRNNSKRYGTENDVHNQRIERSGTPVLRRIDHLQRDIARLFSIHHHLFSFGIIQQTGV